VTASSASSPRFEGPKRTCRLSTDHLPRSSLSHPLRTRNFRVLSPDLPSFLLSTTLKLLPILVPSTTHTKQTSYYSPPSHPINPNRLPRLPPSATARTAPSTDWYLIHVTRLQSRAYQAVKPLTDSVIFHLRLLLVLTISHNTAIMRSRAGSATSNTSNKELSADNLAINVSINDDKCKLISTDNTVATVITDADTAIKLNIRPVHTVANILEFLSASTTLPSDVRLIMDGKPLDPTSTVSELKLSESATLKLDPPVRRSVSPTVANAELPKPIESIKPAQSQSGTSTPASNASRTSTPSGTKKSNRPRCLKEGCKAPAQPIVGDCGFCQKRFCGKHRMLESHNCEGLEDARQADKDRNAAKLEGERTVMLRGL
jgi:hypothetical protein